MTKRWPFLTVALLAVTLVGAALVVGRASRSPSVDPHGTALPAERSVALSTAMPAPSGFDGLHAKLVSGAMPAAAATATVLTDEECQPDAQGISHCLNRLRLADGTELEVRHPHDMAKVACLAPGEHVRLVPSTRT
jgi:hypothetical protein